MTVDTMAECSVGWKVEEWVRLKAAMLADELVVTMADKRVAKMAAQMGPQKAAL